MRRLATIGSIVVLLLIALVAFWKYSTLSHMVQTSSPTPTPQITTLPTPSPSQQAFCTPTDLQSSLTLGAAAGNIYGAFTLKNISARSCAIQGDNTIQVTSSAKNITRNDEGTSQQTLMIAPNQTVYAKVHYPNGPQCQSGIVSSSIMFSYAISPKDTITFHNQSSFPQQMITTCQSPTELTQIDLWHFSFTPVP